MLQVQLDTGEVIKVPASGVRDRQLSIYWRMMRPEFVKGCAQIMANQVRLQLSRAVTVALAVAFGGEAGGAAPAAAAVVSGCCQS